MTEVIFWFSVALIVYTYAGFPFVTWVRFLLWRRPHQSQQVQPSISMLIAAHNEEQNIKEKITNVLALDYPREKLNVVVASDGSSDRTVEILKTFDDPRLTVLDLPRAGKAAALNVGIQSCTGDIVVFSDANSMFAGNAAQLLVRSFADPKVGGVAGDQRYSEGVAGSAADEGERTYWNFDRRMKWWQTRSGHVTSATGAIYAIRRSLFRKVPEGVTDDFITSTSVIEQGYRLVFDMDAASYEPVAADAQIEFGRKVRVITRGLRGVLLRRRLLNPLRFGFYSVQLFSHKVLRRLMVFPLVAIFICSLMLMSAAPVYQFAALAQTVFYTAALCGMLQSRFTQRPGRMLSIPYYFCMVNIACLVAVFRTLTGQRVVLWETKRSHPAAGHRTAVSET